MSRLLINDIDDYMLPSKECVQPVKYQSSSKTGEAKITLNCDYTDLDKA